MQHRFPLFQVTTLLNDSKWALDEYNIREREPDAVSLLSILLVGKQSPIPSCPGYIWIWCPYSYPALGLCRHLPISANFPIGRGQHFSLHSHLHGTEPPADRKSLLSISSHSRPVCRFFSNDFCGSQRLTG